MTTVRVNWNTSNGEPQEIIFHATDWDLERLAEAGIALDLLGVDGRRRPAFGTACYDVVVPPDPALVRRVLKVAGNRMVHLGWGLQQWLWKTATEEERAEEPPLIRGHVAGIIGGQRDGFYVLNRGEAHGVTEDMTFYVFGPKVVIRDPETDAILLEHEPILGGLSVVEARETCSLAIVPEARYGDGQPRLAGSIQVGMAFREVRRPQEELSQLPPRPQRHRDSGAVLDVATS